MSCLLSLRPPYPMLHKMKKRPYISTLAFDSDITQNIYSKMNNFLAIEIDCSAPGSYKGEFALFHKKDAAWFHRIAWMPKLKQGWKRLTYQEFTELYSII